MRPWPILCLLIACGGDGGGGTDDDTDTDGGGTDLVTIDCSAIPQFDLEGADCDGILSAYDQTVARATACNTVDDCQALYPGCSEGMVGACDVIVNYCLTQGDIDAFIDAYAPGCNTDGRQDCPNSGTCLPPSYSCVNNTCVIDLTTPTM